MIHFPDPPITAAPCGIGISRAVATRAIRVPSMATTASSTTLPSLRTSVPRTKVVPPWLVPGAGAFGCALRHPQARRIAEHAMVRLRDMSSPAPRSIALCAGSSRRRHATYQPASGKDQTFRPPFGGRASGMRLGLGLLLFAARLRRRRILLGLEERILFQRRAENVVHRVGEDELHLLLRLVGHVHQILLVALGQDDALDARPVRGEDLLLDAADRQHQPAQ